MGKKERKEQKALARAAKIASGELVEKPKVNKGDKYKREKLKRMAKAAVNGVVGIVKKIGKKNKKKNKNKNAIVEQAVEKKVAEKQVSKKEEKKKMKKDKKNKAKKESGNVVVAEEEKPQKTKKEKKKKNKAVEEKEESPKETVNEVAETKVEKPKKKKQKKEAVDEEEKETKESEEKKEDDHIAEDGGNGYAHDDETQAEGTAGYGREGTAARAFKRVDADEWLGKKGSWDNSYVATFGQDGWGYKAQQILGQVRGKDFRHEKTKKKRGSYKGGEINPGAVCSYKFESDDE